MMTERIFMSVDKSLVPMQRLGAVLVIAVSTVIFSACSNDSSTNNMNDAGLNPSMLDASNATVVYTFKDSSLPPEFHRSFSMTSDSNTSRLTIDSYGDILDDVSMATDFDALSLVLTRLEQSDLPEKTGFSDSGCTGGESSFLRLYYSSDLQTSWRSIDIYECDSAEATLAMQELRNIIDPVLEPFDVATRINNTRQ